MCGRFLLTSPIDTLRQTFGVDTHANIPSRYNIAPTQPILALRLTETDGLHPGPKQLAAMEWGLVPEWSKERSAKPLINARSETAREKPSFRASVKRRRCLIPANGWYEWKSEAGVKQPYLMQPKDGELFAFAGLWSLWHGPGGEHWLETAAILTEQAKGPLAKVHGRKPVMLKPAYWDSWLQPQDPTPADFLAGLPRLAEDSFDLIRVSRRVNSIHFDDDLCIAPEKQPTAAPLPVQGSLF